MHFPKGRAEALTTAGMLSIRGQEGATLDAGDGSAAVKGSSVLMEAGGGYALGGNREGVAAVATSTLKASSSVVEASGATGVSISAPAGVSISSGGDDGGGGGVTVASAAGVTLSSAGGTNGAGTGIVLDAGKTEGGARRGVVIAGGVLSGNSNGDSKAGSSGLDVSGGSRIRLRVQSQGGRRPSTRPD